MSMPSVLIRPSRADDIPAMQLIETRAAELFRGTGLIDLDDMDIHTTQHHQAAIEDGMSFLAELDGVPVGFVVGETDGDAAYLHELDVDPSGQRKGVGAKLVEAFCAHCKSENLNTVYLSTFRDVAWNAPFYARLGFHELPRADYLPRMIEIEAAQAASLDISKRLFMCRDL